jgi:hypothetical protein
MTTTAFKRGLSEDLIKWLTTAPGRVLCAAFAEHKLDVRLRGDYLNAYRAECSVAKVEWQGVLKRAVLSIHWKYLANTPELLTSPKRGEYCYLALSAEHTKTYCSSLPMILRAVEDYIGEEGRWEQRCVEANLEGTPLLVIDRQIVNGRPLIKLDILAVAPGTSGATLVAVELKRDLDNRIQDVPKQALKYVEMLDPDGFGLRADIAASYADVCRQLRMLGFKACDPALIRPGMRVVGLVGLANYNEKSRLLGRAREAASHLDRPIRFCRLDGDQLTLPPESEWFT